MSSSSTFEVFVSKDTFKFNAAHFVAFKGFRERLHGHNYRVGVRLLGSRNKIAHDGYLIDFGDVKDVTKRVCKELNEHFICPMLSNVLQIQYDGDDPKSKNVTITCEDGSQLSIPAADCAMLPIVHSTAEELAIYLYGEILKGLDGQVLTQKRGIHTMEVSVAEAPGQEAVFRLAIPPAEEVESRLHVRNFVEMGDPAPCSTPLSTTQPPSCCAMCDQKLRWQLNKIADALNQRTTDNSSLGHIITAESLELILQGNTGTAPNG